MAQICDERFPGGSRKTPCSAHFQLLDAGSPNRLNQVHREDQRGDPRAQAGSCGPGAAGVHDRATGREGRGVIHRAHHFEMVERRGVAEVIEPAQINARSPSSAHAEPIISTVSGGVIQPACCRTQSKSAVFPPQSRTRPHHQRLRGAAPRRARPQKGAGHSISPIRLPAQGSKVGRSPGFPTIRVRSTVAARDWSPSAGRSLTTLRVLAPFCSSAKRPTPSPS